MFAYQKAKQFGTVAKPFAADVSLRAMTTKTTSKTTKTIKV